jgi:preprotein translocase subunit YajC
MILIPDYISPVIAWRVWQLAKGGIASLNGQPWLPGEPLTASCAAPALVGPLLRGAYPRHGADEVPALKCSCGVYATSSFSFLRRMEYERYGIKGEVYLWGKVVEHENGWRAQFAYPKSLLLSADRLPATLAGVKSRLESLVTYRADILVAGHQGSILLWSATCGYQAEGLEWLIDRGRQYYQRRRQERSLAAGDRVAIVGSGMAIVTAADDKKIQAALGNGSVLTLKRNQVEWNRVNLRWETLSAGPPLAEMVCAPCACSPPSPPSGARPLAGTGGCNPWPEPFCATGLHNVQPDCTSASFVL